MVRVGDGLSCLYTTAGAIALDDSANITLHGVSVYVAKGGPSESGGDGAHLWKDCYFGPRPGTNQWKGADGYLVAPRVTDRRLIMSPFDTQGMTCKISTASGAK